MNIDNVNASTSVYIIYGVNKEGHIVYIYMQSRFEFQFLSEVKLPPLNRVLLLCLLVWKAHVSLRLLVIYMYMYVLLLVHVAGKTYMYIYSLKYEVGAVFHDRCRVYIN